jgi:hypothetical protein
MLKSREIVDALIARNPVVTEQFFFKDCRPLFVSIIRNVFSYEVDYDEFVNEFYIYLMEDDARRLRQFECRSSIFQWIKVVAIRYFIAKRNRMIDLNPQKPLIDKSQLIADEHSVAQDDAKIDVETLLAKMPNRRYAYVVRRLLLDDAEPQRVAQELKIEVFNLYNIKKRAIASLTELALKEFD